MLNIREDVHVCRIKKKSMLLAHWNEEQCLDILYLSSENVKGNRRDAKDEQLDAENTPPIWLLHTLFLIQIEVVG